MHLCVYSISNIFCHSEEKEKTFSEFSIGYLGTNQSSQMVIILKYLLKDFFERLVDFSFQQIFRLVILTSKHPEILRTVWEMLFLSLTELSRKMRNPWGTEIRRRLESRGLSLWWSYSCSWGICLHCTQELWVYVVIWG